MSNLKYMLLWVKMVENDKVFSRIVCIFGAVKFPRSGLSEAVLRLRSLSEGGPPLAENFQNYSLYWSKLMIS